MQSGKNRPTTQDKPRSFGHVISNSTDQTEAKESVLENYTIGRAIGQGAYAIVR